METLLPRPGRCPPAREGAPAVAVEGSPHPAPEKSPVCDRLSAALAMGLGEEDAGSSDSAAAEVRIDGARRSAAPPEAAEAEEAAAAERPEAAPSPADESNGAASPPVTSVAMSTSQARTVAPEGPAM